MALRAVPGARKGATLFTVGDGFYYRYIKVSTSKTDYTCYKKDCEARVFGIYGSGILKNNLKFPHHNHDPEPDMEAVFLLRERIVARVEKESLPPKQIFDEECNKLPVEVADQLPFKQLLQSIQKFRNKGSLGPTCTLVEEDVAAVDWTPRLRSNRNMRDCSVDSDVRSTSQAGPSSMTSPIKKKRKSGRATSVEVLEDSRILNIESDPCASTSNFESPSPEPESEWKTTDQLEECQMSHTPPHVEPTPEEQDLSSGNLMDKQGGTDLQTTENISTSGVTMEIYDAPKSENICGKMGEPKNTKEVQISNIVSNEKTLESAIQRLETVSNKLIAASLVDSYDQFGKYISTVLRGLPIKKVHSLKQKILTDVMAILSQEESGSLKKVSKDAQGDGTQEIRPNVGKSILDQSQQPNLPKEQTSLASKMLIRGNIPVYKVTVTSPPSTSFQHVHPDAIANSGSSEDHNLISTFDDIIPCPIVDEAALKNVDENLIPTTLPQPMVSSAQASGSQLQSTRGRKRRKSSAAYSTNKLPATCQATTSGEDSSFDDTPISSIHERQYERSDLEMDIEDGDELSRIKQEDLFETVICGENSALFIKEEAPDPDCLPPLASSPHTCALCNTAFPNKHQLDTHHSSAHTDSKIGKRDQRKWNESDMSKAIDAVRKRKMGWKKASKQFNVPRTTLMRLSNVKYGTPEEASKVKRGRPQSNWSESDMSKAIDAVRKRKMGLKKASKQFNVPKTTLMRLSNVKYSTPEEAPKVKLEEQTNCS